MFFLIEITGLAAIKTLLVGIPEAIELLGFGIGLVVAVVLLRWFLDRGNAEKLNEKFGKKGIN